MASATPIIGDIADVAEAAGKVAQLIAQWEAEHNSPAMLQAAVAATFQKNKDDAEAAVASQNTTAVEKGVS